MPFSYLDFRAETGTPRRQEAVFDVPRLTPLRKPVAESTVGLFVSCGAHLATQPPLEEVNDITYRLLPRDVPVADVQFSHMTPVRAWAEQDLNVAYPRDRMVELEAEGTIGRLAPRAVSMLGSISRYTELIQDVVPQVKAEFDEDDVDLVVLFPF